MHIAWGKVLVWLLWALLPLGALVAAWGAIRVAAICISGVGGSIAAGFFSLTVVAVSLMLGLGLGLVLSARVSRIGGGAVAALSPVLAFAAFFLWFHQHPNSEPFGPDWCYAEPYRDP